MIPLVVGIYVIIIGSIDEKLGDAIKISENS
jgi:hypothetical protein